ncbi:MAG TPA: sigma-54-dependent Fis family transcriptional regulator, partial [Deltaproteobacteria bacterium]|nr:sigma-54-dependent Fis family transcriptional regulator [Deltaproteobacteria bacterium]
AQRTQRPVPAISPPALKALLSYHWPGNVRELFGALEYAFVTCRSNYIEPEHLPMTIIGKQHKKQVRRRKFEDLVKSQDEILDALKRTGYNKTAAARLLGVSRVTLWKWLKKLPELSTQ